MQTQDLHVSKPSFPENWGNLGGTRALDFSTSDCTSVPRGFAPRKRGERPRVPPKSKRSRRDLPIPGVAERYRFLKPADVQPDDFVFQKHGEPLDERALLRQELKPVLRRLKLDFPGFGWHTFRRTHLTVFSEEGGTAFETRDQAGHAKVETTMGYIRTSLDRRTKAVSKVTERLLPPSNAGIMRELGVPENPALPVNNSNETGSWWARGDSNARPLPCQGSSGQSLTDIDTENKRVIRRGFGPQMDLRRSLDLTRTSQTDAAAGTTLAFTRAVVLAFSMLS